MTTINRVETPTVIGKKLPEMEVNLYDLEGICLGMSITAVPDSGAETSVIGTNVLTKLGMSSLITEMPEGIIAKAADGLRMKIDGIFTARVEYRGKSVDTAFLVCPQHKGMLLAWEKCVALDILPTNFPTPLRLVSNIPYGSVGVQSVEIDVEEIHIEQTKQGLITEFKDVFDGEGPLPEMKGQPPMVIDLNSDDTP